MVAMRGRYFSRRDSEPNRSIIQLAMLWIDMKAAVETSPSDRASKIRAASSRDRPEPPTSSRT